MNKILSKIYENAKINPDKVIYCFLMPTEDGWKEDAVTYSILWDNITKYANKLSYFKSSRGSKVVIFSDNSKENIYTVFASMALGMTFSLIPAPTDTSKIERYISVINSFEPSFVITNNRINSILSTKKIEGLTEYDTEIINISDYSSGSESFDFADVTDESLVYLQYTSGSTSMPKGIKISQKNLESNLKDLCDMFKIELTPDVMSWVPFFHNIGLVAIVILSAYVGRKSYMLGTDQFMKNPYLWLKAISDYKITLTVAPNSAYDLCNKIIPKPAADKLDLSSVVYFANGSEAVMPQTVYDFCNLFEVNADTFVPCYGLAESVCLVSAETEKFVSYKISYDKYIQNSFEIDENDPKAKNAVSLGRVSDKTEVAIIVPGTDCIAEKGCIGEICIKSNCVSEGYIGDIEENNNFGFRIKGREGGFLRTGDLGIIYEDRLYITGRKKELIILNGHNIYPDDIKSELKNRIPVLANCNMCVFSFNYDLKERVVLCVETDDLGDISSDVSDEIISIVNKHFAFSLFDVVFVKKFSLSRTDNGKLQTHKIRRDYKNNNLSSWYSSKTTVKEAKEYIFVDEVDKIVKRIFDNILKRSDYELTDSFLDLGGNSFDTIELISELEQYFDISLNVNSVLVNPTVIGISDYIRRKRANEDTTVKKTNLYDEVILPDDFCMENEYEILPSECKNIFLTGSTGFLGAHLIKSLLTYADDIIVYCHCRAKDTKNGLERIKNNMLKYECWDESFAERIVPVRGDLGKPKMGIDDEEYNSLSEIIDAIYHNGALLNFMFPYEYLKTTNVFGTQECLKFAGKGRAKYFHYISSFSVYDNPSHFNTIAYENDALESADGYFLGYSETKWVSEKIIAKAENKGLKAAIYRPGDITGSREKSIWEMGDLVSRVLVSCIQMKTMPNVFVNIFFTPVDYVSDSVVNISFNDDVVGRKFNIINTDIIDINQLADIFAECGYDVEKISYPEWQEMLWNSEVGKNSLKILECLFQDSDTDERCIIRRYSDLEATFDTTNTDKFLENTGIRCLPVDSQLISGYLNYFSKKGYIDNKVCVK